MAETGRLGPLVRGLMVSEPEKVIDFLLILLDLHVVLLDLCCLSYCSLHASDRAYEGNDGSLVF